MLQLLTSLTKNMKLIIQFIEDEKNIFSHLNQQMLYANANIREKELKNTQSSVINKLQRENFSLSYSSYLYQIHRI